MYEAIPGWLQYLPWLGFLLYWIASARDTKPVDRAEPLWLRLCAYWLPLARLIADHRTTRRVKLPKAPPSPATNG